MTYSVDKLREGLMWANKYGCMNMPNGLFPGGEDTSIFRSRDNWEAYEWNPDADSSADLKPTWKDLQGLAGDAESHKLKKSFCNKLRLEVQRRITEAYGEQYLDNEVMLRLRGGQTSLQDAERERLRRLYREAKKWIKAASVSELEIFDITLSRRWNGSSFDPS